MPLLIILLLLIVLVAQFGFWDALATVFGAIGITVLVVLTVTALIALTGYLVYRRFTR